jgi:tetratricopeptide (TPR) repeat protein
VFIKKGGKMKNYLIAILIAVFILSTGGCAAKDYQLLKGADRKNAEDWLESANLLYRVRDYGAAMDYYEKIIENYPDSIYADAAQKRFEKAKKYYLKSLKSN